MFDRQKLILITTKYASYLINIAIVGAVVCGIAVWIHLLILSAK